MRWLQIVVERSDERTTLTVNDEMCEIPGKIYLAESNIEDAFDVGALDKGKSRGSGDSDASRSPRSISRGSKKT